MRVLHVLHTSLPYLCGYSIRSDYIARFQKDQGIEPTVVTSGQQPNVTQAQEEINGILHWRTPMQKQKLPPLVREWELIRSLQKRIGEAIEKTNPDIIHAHSPVLVGYPALQMARRNKIPLVYEVRDLWENASVDRGKFKENSPQYQFARNMETFVLSRANATITICEGLATELAPRVRSRDGLFVVGNGVDTDRFVPIAKSDAFSARWNLAGKQIIAYIGTFQPYEGLHILIEALPQIQQSVPNAHLMIVGSGGVEQALREQAKQLPEGSVTFTGRLSHEEVNDAYSVADILVYPRTLSRTTALTTPLKPLEAMAMGKMVIVSDVPAIQELVQHDVTGLTFAQGNTKDLAQQCIKALTSPEDREKLQSAARTWVVEERNWPGLIARYKDIYQYAKQVS